MRLRIALLCLFAALVPSVFAPSALADSAPHWFKVRSEHFIVVTDSNDKEAHRIAGEFERMRSMFRAVLPHANSDAASPIVVLALKDKKGFDALEPASYLGKNQLQLAGLFLRTPGSNYILVRLDSEQEHPFATVYHEYTHFVMRRAEWMPLWLGEGLAEFYQNTDIEGKDIRLGQPSPYDIYYLRDHKLLPLTTLFTVDHASPYYHDEEKGSIFYAESWALVHYLEVNDSKGKTHRVQDYATNLIKHEDSLTAAQHAFGDLNKLQKELDDYVSHSSFTYYKIANSITLDEASLHSEPISVNDANALRADVLAFDQREAEAKTLAEAVLRDDPNNAQAHVTLGSLCYQQQDMACAKKWFTEAVKLDTHDSFALFSYAELSMGDGDRSHDKEIEDSLKESIRLEPAFAPAYDALAHFYQMHQEKLSEAHVANLHAIELEPEVLSYRINAAVVLMAEDNYGGALQVLRNAEALFKSPGDAAILGQRIHELESYQAAVKGAQENAKGSVTTSVSADGATKTVTFTKEAAPDDDPHYPDGALAGPHHTASGTLHAVKCLYPTVFTIELVQPKQTLALYSNNYMKIPFTSLAPTGDAVLDVCHGIEGWKARVEYADVNDPRVKGRIVSIELSK